MAITRTIPESDIVSEYPSPTYQLVDFINLLTYFIEGVLAFRLIFIMFGASARAGFVQFIYNVTDPLVDPFRGMFGTIVSEGFVFDPSTLVAMLVYLLLSKALIDLVRVATQRRWRLSRE